MPPVSERKRRRFHSSENRFKILSFGFHWVIKAKIGWHGPCNDGGNFKPIMNNSLLKNLAFNLATGALAFAVFTFTSLSAETAISLFAVSGLVGIILHDYRQPRAAQFEPAPIANPVKRPAGRRRVASLVAA
jgi:hypothetical protein